MKHFLKMTDLSTDALGILLENGAAFKAQRNQGTAVDLSGQTWALLFHKSSTRTRVSFEVGIHELGGHAMILDQKRMQTGRGETVEDTARVMSRYVHGMIIRTYEQAFIETFAEAAGIPVINALTDRYHPCQLVADLLTLAERWGEPGKLMESLKGRRVAFLGDCSSNMAHSWILAAAMTGIELHLSGPEAFAPQAFIEEALGDAGLPSQHRFLTDPAAAAKDADMLYTDVWVSMGTEEESAERVQLMQPYQVNEDLMALGKPEAYFMHCLPAHVGEEVSAGVYADPRSIVFDQAENRLHAQKAILSMLASNHRD
jgi:ornithine carbamoyltransferase